MLLTLSAIAGVALVLAALVLHAARSAAHRRRSLKRAELIRQRLQEETTPQRVAFRKIQIRLSGS
jgi:hypothetical protein